MTNDHPTLMNHVVWADNVPRMRESVGFLFAGHRVDATMVASSVEAVETARLVTPKVIVLHNLEPALENYATCAALRQDPALSNLFVMVGTGPYERDDMLDLLHCGADISIDRPIDPEILLELILEVFTGCLTSFPSASGAARTVLYRRA